MSEDFFLCLTLLLVIFEWFEFLLNIKNICLWFSY